MCTSDFPIEDKIFIGLVGISDKGIALLIVNAHFTKEDKIGMCPYPASRRKEGNCFGNVEEAGNKKIVPQRGRKCPVFNNKTDAI